MIIADSFWNLPRSLLDNPISHTTNVVIATINVALSNWKIYPRKSPSGDP